MGQRKGREKPAQMNLPSDGPCVASLGLDEAEPSGGGGGQPNRHGATRVDSMSNRRNALVNNTTYTTLTSFGTKTRSGKEQVYLPLMTYES
jgi:hypothetical protein